MSRRSEGPARAVLALALALLPVGCARPIIEGGQIPDPPPGFGLDASCSSARTVFPPADLRRQVCYFTRGEPHSSIVIGEFSGLADAAAVTAAHDQLARRYTAARYGSIEELRIDGRPAWGWLETQESRGAVVSLEYKAVVAYPDRRYSIEFYTADPRLRDPEQLRATVQGFRVIRSGQLEPVTLLVVLLAAAGLFLLYRRVKVAEREKRPAVAATTYRGPPLGRPRT